MKKTALRQLPEISPRTKPIHKNLRSLHSFSCSWTDRIKYVIGTCCRARVGAKSYHINVVSKTVTIIRLRHAIYESIAGGKRLCRFAAQCGSRLNDPHKTNELPLQLSRTN